MLGNYSLTKIKNFDATPEQLKQQLDELIDTGQITMEQYEWGMKGIDLIVGNKEILTNVADKPRQEADFRG